jgi:hypothetical protein
MAVVMLQVMVTPQCLCLLTLVRQMEDMLDQLLLRRQTRWSQLNIFVFLEDDPFCFLLKEVRCGF